MEAKILGGNGGANNELDAIKNKITELNSQCEEKQETIIDKETEISFLHGENEDHKQLMEENHADIEKLQSDYQSKINSLVEKLNTATCEWGSRFEEKVLAIREEQDMLKADATEKIGDTRD